MLARGEDREKSVPRVEYFNDGYFEISQLLSMTQQIHDIHALRPASVLEIGPGNGFVSTFLRRAGIEVVTADINPALEPDICAPLSEIPRHLNGRRFDLVVCCEVLEHMPFEQFEDNVKTMRSIGDRLYMTLPNYKKAFGLGGLIRLPRIAHKPFGWYFTYRQNRKLTDQHFWEVDYSRECRLSAIVSILKRHYPSVTTERYPFNAYHQAFVAK